MAVNRYVDTSATYNGDGTTAAQAASDGGVGAYNSIATALANAPNAPSSGSEWDIWVRRLSSDISITAQLSPANDGSYNAPHRLIGWPFRVQHTGYTVDSVPSGTDDLGFNNAQWQFVDSALTEGDNYWIGAEVEFTSGNNNGLKRMVIWFDAASDTVYLDFPLPNDIAASDQYTITLETEEYSNRPQSGIDEGWDSDSYVRPKVDGSGQAIDCFYFSGDAWWRTANLYVKSDTNKHTIYRAETAKNILSEGGYFITQTLGEKCFMWGCTNVYGTIREGGSWVNSHVLSGVNATTEVPKRYSGAYFKNCTFGRISNLTGSIFKTVYSGIIAENVLFVNDDSVVNYYDPAYQGWNPDFKYPSVSMSGVNGEPDKFRQYYYQGEIYNVDEDGTINPPSGATTFIKVVPASSTVCNDFHPLSYKEQRYQSSGSKTYTWKIYPTGWSGLNTSDIELEAWYLDESTGTHRAITTANPSSVTNDSWNDLSITVNPSQAGTVYFTLKLKRYEASAYIALDPEPSVT